MLVDVILAAADRLSIALAPEEAALAGETLAGLTQDKAAPWQPHPQAAIPADALGAIACDIPARSVHDGPLRGMQLAVKDNIAVAGVPTAIGSGLPGFVGIEDASVVGRASSAGAVPTVKAQCEAFLLGANSFSSQPHPVRNPVDPRRSAGGSSSGSAALVAAGACDLALGTDSAGSIRIPAAYCGIVGLKPGRGAVPYTGIAPLAPFLECAGPMGRMVRDVTDLYAAIAGPDDIDPRQVWTVQPLIGPSASGKTVLRLGVLDDAFALCDAPLSDALDMALRASGGELVGCAWPHWEDALAHHTAIYLASEAASSRSGGETLLARSNPPGWAEWNAGLNPATLPRLKQVTLTLGTALLARDPGVLARGMAAAARLAQSIDALLDGVDVLALPTTRTIAPLVPDEPTPGEVFGDTILTAPFNLTGHPALSLPAGRHDGMPVGLQLIGRRGGEAHLLACAALIERALVPQPDHKPETAR
ncbi:MAG: amidase [Blastomonas sp.]|nr:amidase [Blastomonas sp.]